MTTAREAFTAAAAAYVDALVDELPEAERDAIASEIDAGATLRLATNVAPSLSIALYLVKATDPPTCVVVAAWPLADAAELAVGPVQ